MPDCLSTAIPLSEAVARATAWRDASTKPTINSFLVRLVDLECIISEHKNLGAEHARLYLTKVYNPISRAYDAGLVFVGADVDEQDILPTLNDPTNPDSRVWDVVKPCPPICGDGTSPLATGLLP